MRAPGSPFKHLHVNVSVTEYCNLQLKISEFKYTLLAVFTKGSNKLNGRLLLDISGSRNNNSAQAKFRALVEYSI